MNHLVREEIKHFTSQGGDMDSFEWVLTKLLFIPYISIYNKFQWMNMNMNIRTLANNNMVIGPHDHA